MLKPYTHRYLLRFDDLCPTMNWSIWEQIESVLANAGIKPIVAVVPDNRDPKLMVEPPHSDFWKRVRDWQSRGWTVALHGYQHVYVNDNPGIIGITPHSEFAGLSADEQEGKLRAGMAIFEEQGVACNAWVAPSHSFDECTVALLSSLGVTIISDGLSTRPFVDKLGNVWIPCQLWERFAARSAGAWTVCIHHNGWGQDRVEAFRRDIEEYRDRITSVGDLLTDALTPLSIGERLLAFQRGLWQFRGRRAIKRCLKRMR